jgi:glycosyltransferase involved in cell wall biosynthesis
MSVSTTVLHVAAGNGYGGIERMLLAFAQSAHPRLQQRFVVAFGGRLERDLAGSGASVDRLPSPRASRPMTIWRARREFAALLGRIAPDVAIFHGAWPHAMFAAVARSNGVRVGFWQHQPIATPAWPDRWARRVRPDFVVFNSGYTQLRPAFPDVPGAVIHCPVASTGRIEPDERRRRRAELGAAETDVVVLMAARLERWKGHEILLQAASTIRPGVPVRVWVAGGAQRASELGYEKTLAALVAAPESAGRISLLGDRGDVPGLMLLADVYCQPNLRGEPFGIAIAEAMLAGLPCVVSAAGGAAELLDESCAVFTRPGDAADVAAALCRLAEDPDLRARMGRAARARASQMTDPARRLEELAAVVAADAA